MNPEDEVRRANEARLLADHPLFKEARENLENQIRQLRRKVPIGQTDMHTRLILMEQLADQFFGFFDVLVQSGKFAQLELDRKSAAQTMYEKSLLAFKRFGRSGI